MNSKLAILFLSSMLFSNAFAIEPTPKSPAKEKVEKIQRSGGALKIENKPANLEVTPSNQPDPAMRIIENTTQSNRDSLPVVESEHMWGPSLQVSFPHPLNLGLIYLHKSKLFSAEINAGSMELKNIEDAGLEIQNQELNVRYHPLGSAFYLGFGYGKQKLKAKRTENVSGQMVDAHVTFDSDYSVPHFGWMTGTQKGGFFWAFEVGWQMPTNGKTKVRTNVDLSGDPEYDDLIQDINDTVKKAGKKSIPNVALLKFGWLF